MTQTRIGTSIRARKRGALTIALLAALTAGLMACGGGDSGSGDATTAFRWEVSLATAPPACFKPGSSLRLNVAVYSKGGTLLSNPRYDVTSNVPGAIEADGSGGWTMRGEGAARVTVTYTGDTDPGATIAPVTLDVLRDGTMPQIAIRQPARGAMVTAAGDIRVQGEATDATSPIRSLTINGIEQVGAATGLTQAIDATPPGRWGLNIIDIVATDSCGNRATHTQSYLRSTEYRPAATGPNAGARVARGQTLKLTQAAVDDQDRADVDDFATLIERYFERNLGSVVAQATSGQVIHRVSAGCPGVGYTLSVPSPGARVTGPRVNSVTLESGTMTEKVSLDRISVPLRIVQVTRIGIPLTGCTLTTIDLRAAISANVTSISTSTQSVMANGRVDVSLPSVTVLLADVQLSLTGVSTIDNILSSLLDLMKGYIESAIEDVIRSELPPLVEDFLNTPLTASTTIAGGPFNLTLTAVAGVDGIGVTEPALTQSAYTQIHPASVGTPYPALGAIARPTTAANLSANPGPMTYALDDNLINQSLWALWHGGAMEIPDIIGYPGIALRVSALLPPVLMPGKQPGAAAFGLGDLAVKLSLDLVADTGTPIPGPVVVEAYVSYVLDGAIAYDVATRDLHLRAAPEDRRAHVHITRISNGTDDITDAAIRERITTYAERFISRSIEQLADDTLISTVLPPLRFQLNEPAAGGTVDAIVMEVKALARTADHIVVDLALKAEEPPNAQLEGYLTLNKPWTQQDLIDRKIPENLRNTTVHIEDPNAALVPSRSTTVFDYQRTKRPQCDSAGQSQGKKICLPQWKFPLDYGWYCGAGRPVVGFTDNPVLDPVDYCCVLHDRQIWAAIPDLRTDPVGHADAQARNACGVVMCMSQAMGFPADIVSRLPDVERARRQMYNKASIICGPEVQPEIPAPQIVAP